MINNKQDPFRQPVERLSNLQVQEKAANAHTLLNDPVFQEALNAVYSRAIGILGTAEVGSLTAGAAHASMKAVLDLRNQLEEYVTDNKVRQKYHTEKSNG
jgi:hypothetical protein